MQESRGSGVTCKQVAEALAWAQTLEGGKQVDSELVKLQQVKIGISQYLLINKIKQLALLAEHDLMRMLARALLPSKLEEAKLNSRVAPVAEGEEVRLLGGWLKQSKDGALWWHSIKPGSKHLEERDAKLGARKEDELLQQAIKGVELLKRELGRLLSGTQVTANEWFKA